MTTAEPEMVECLGCPTNGCVKGQCHRYHEPRLRAPAASVAPEPTAAIEAGRNTLRWLLNLTTEFDRKDVRTRQAARLLDDYGDGRGSTNRQLLEALWAALSGVAPEQPKGTFVFDPALKPSPEPAVAEPKWKDHEIRELVNDVTKAARLYSDTQQLRARIVDALSPALAALKGATP